MFDIVKSTTGRGPFAPERRAMSKDNALAFVGQIMTAYKAIMKAEGSALEYAIECGKYLTLAKENVEAAKPKRKWTAWLDEHSPDIHRNTAALYIQSHWELLGGEWIEQNVNQFVLPLGNSCFVADIVGLD
jgi:hypothetical protein